MTNRPYRPLENWLEKKTSLDYFFSYGDARPNLELGAFVSLDLVYPLHEIVDIKPQSLEIGWNKTNSYIESAFSIIDGDAGTSLDSEEAFMIREELGDPPEHCYPIYIFTVDDGNEERVVYVGKTSSNHSRFSGGHIVCAKLHHPDYAGMVKRVYLCCVTFLTANSYLPIEFISDLNVAQKLLLGIEASLIYDFQPIFNNHHKKNRKSCLGTIIHMQNSTGVTNFLDDHFVWP